MSSLESMRIPGTSDYATVQTYKTLKRMGLASVDVQPETMKRAVSAMMAGDGTEVPLSMRKTTRPTGFNPPAKGSTGKDRAEPPRALLYSPPVNALKRAAGVRRTVAARVEKLAKDPDEMGALRKRLELASLKADKSKAKDTGVDHIGAHVASLAKYRKDTRLAEAAARREEREERARAARARAESSRIEKRRKPSRTCVGRRPRRNGRRRRRRAPRVNERNRRRRTRRRRRRRRRRGGNACGFDGDGPGAWRWRRGRRPNEPPR
jgi:hypothetical protein